MQKSDLLYSIQQEILWHDFSYFVDQPPSIAQHGKGVVVPGRTPSMGAQCFKLMKGIRPLGIHPEGVTTLGNCAQAFLRGLCRSDNL